jgi:hypothetical protein
MRKSIYIWTEQRTEVISKKREREQRTEGLVCLSLARFIAQLE